MEPVPQSKSTRSDMEALEKKGWNLDGDTATKDGISIKDTRPEYGFSFGLPRVLTSDGKSFDDPGEAAAHAERIANGGGQ